MSLTLEQFHNLFYKYSEAYVNNLTDLNMKFQVQIDDIVSRLGKEDQIKIAKELTNEYSNINMKLKTALSIV